MFPEDNMIEEGPSVFIIPCPSQLMPRPKSQIKAKSLKLKKYDLKVKKLPESEKTWNQKKIWNCKNRPEPENIKLAAEK